MAQMIFVNLPVTDLARSKAFYEACGGTPDPRFCDDTAAGLSFSDTIHVMLVTRERFATFTSRPIVDAHQAVQVGLCLSAESREAVDAAIERAVAAGGVGDPNPPEDHGFMYSRGYADPDGHMWDRTWMDVDAAMAASGAEHQSNDAAAQQPA